MNCLPKARAGGDMDPGSRALPLAGVTTEGPGQPAAQHHRL